MNKIKYSAAIFIVLLLTSCTDLFLPNLARQNVTILAPANNVLLTNATVTFWWNPVNTATQYEVQVVQPSFASAQTLVMDSIVTGTKCFASLSPGSYQWRVQASNGGTTTPWTTYSFRIDSNLNIINQTIVPISPANNAEVGRTVTFQWGAVYSATSYNFFIYNSANTQINTNTSITGTSTQYWFTADGTYTWKISAQNANGSTSPVTNTFIVDSTAPTTPAGFTATNYATPSDSFTLSWTRATPPSGITYHDTLVIYRDSLQSVVARAKSITTTSPVTYVDSLAGGGLSYYAKVATKDAAGNISPFTTLLRFILP